MSTTEDEHAHPDCSMDDLWWDSAFESDIADSDESDDDSDDDDEELQEVLRLLERMRKRRRDVPRPYATESDGKRRKLKRLPQCYGEVNSWSEWEDNLTDIEFYEAYRMDKTLFHQIVLNLWHDLEKDELRQQQASGCKVEPQLILAIGLSYLAGGKFVREKFWFGVSKPYCYVCKNAVIGALIRYYGRMFALEKRLNDVSYLQQLEAGFARRSRCVIRGCISCLDGLVVKIITPSKKECRKQKSCWNRKGVEALLLLAACDADCIFTWGSMKTVGSTYDISAYYHTTLFNAIDNNELCKDFYLFGDDAFKAAEQILTPYPPDKNGELTVKQDAFNFWQSNSRITIECAFGMMVNKWAVLQQPLRGKFSRHKDTIQACMILHNLCTNHRIQGGLSEEDCPRSTSISDVVEFCNNVEQKFPTNFALCRDALNKDNKRFFKGQQGRRRRQERSACRDKIATYILDKGNERDCLSQWLHLAGLVRPKRKTFTR